MRLYTVRGVVGITIGVIGGPTRWLNVIIYVFSLIVGTPYFILVVWENGLSPGLTNF